MSDGKQFTVEFDDALLDLEGWKRPRYNGSKLTAAKINKYTAGDITYGKTPVLEKKTNAIYIANTVIDASQFNEDDEFIYTTIKNHCYIGIDKMLLINDDDDSITTIEGKGVGEDIVGNTDFLGFNRFLTSDFPTGAKFQIKVLDESKQTSIKPSGYHVKMNKGYLLPSFKFNQADDNINYDERNGIYFYNHGIRNFNERVNGVQQNNQTLITDPNVDGHVPTGSFSSGSLRFRYANFFGGATTTFQISASTPSFASSSILQNEFTDRYYSGSYGLILDPFPGVGAGTTQAEKYAGSGIGSASAFISVDTLNFLRNNNQDPNIAQVDKTELHITFFEGTKDFAPTKNDERSISTFEIDPNQTQLLGDECNAGLPLINELKLKGARIPQGDHRFTPSIPTHRDTVHSVSFTTSSTPGVCNTLANLSTFDDISVYVQGGNAGQVGNLNLTKPSDNSPSFDFSIGSDDNVNLLGEGPLPPEAFYSGSFSYQLSFLRKDHVIIADINKNVELPNGIGNKGMVLIPENLDKKIKSNLDFYLNKAGLTTTKINKKPINTKKFK